MMEYKPIFKKREIVVELPKNDFSLGADNEEIIATVEYIGKGVINYKVGDTIIFKKSVGSPLKFIGENYWKIENEDYVICQLHENI